jgi:hypothetical protein
MFIFLVLLFYFLSSTAFYYPVNTNKYFEVPSSALPDNHNEPVVVGLVVGRFVNLREPKEPVDV